MANFKNAGKEGSVISFWPILGERNALVFLRAAEDHEWFRNNPQRDYRVRPVEPFEIATLTPFERKKLANAADLRVVAAGREVLPKQAIVMKPPAGDMLGRPVPVVPNVAPLPDTDASACMHLSCHWADERSRAFFRSEAWLAFEREMREGQSRPGFRAQVKITRKRLRSPFDPPRPDLLREGCYEVFAVGEEAIASLAATPQAPQPPLTGRIIRSPFDDIPRGEPSAPAPSPQPAPVIETSQKLRAPWAQGPDDWPMPPGAA
jgi:hypothetical protein